MELVIALKKSIKDYLNLADIRLEKIQENNEAINKIVTEIIRKDKNKEDCTELIVKQRMMVAFSFLYREDLLKNLSQLSSYYKLAKIAGVDLNLSEEEIKRMEHTLANDVYHFVEKKGKIISNQPDLEEKTIEKIKSNKRFTPELFLEEIRKLPIYAEENKK